MFDYRVSILEGDRGNNYDIPPRATQVEVDFIGCFPVTIQSPPFDLRKTLSNRLNPSVF